MSTQQAVTPQNPMRPGSLGHKAIELVRASEVGRIHVDQLASELEVGASELRGFLGYPVRLGLLRYTDHHYELGDGIRSDDIVDGRAARTPRRVDPPPQPSKAEAWVRPCEAACADAESCTLTHAECPRNLRAPQDQLPVPALSWPPTPPRPVVVAPPPRPTPPIQEPDEVTAPKQPAQAATRKPPAAKKGGRILQLPDIDIRSLEVRNDRPLPVPIAARQASRYDATFETLERDGESVLLPVAYRATVGGAARKYQKRTGIPLLVRLYVDKNGKEWCGVWRMKAPKKGPAT